MFEANANSNKKKDRMVSQTILPDNFDFESESFEYGINLPKWLLENIKTYKNSQDKNYLNSDIIFKALKLAYSAHKGQFRASGEPYIIHPIAVADLLKEIGASQSVIAVSYTHLTLPTMS